MKFIHFYGALVTTVLMMACGSGGDDPIGPETPDVPDKPSTPEITVPDGEEDYFVKDLIFESKGGEKTIAFKSTVDWTMTTTATDDKTQWCSIHPTSGKAGECFVKVKVKENPFYDERNQTLILTASSLKRNVRIIQKQKNALIIKQKEFNVKAEGDVIHVKLNRNIDYSIQIEDNWITQTSTRGLVEDVLSFTIKANKDTAKRSGKIILSNKDNKLSESVIVNQYGKSNDDGDASGTAPDFPWE